MFYIYLIFKLIYMLRILIIFIFFLTSQSVVAESINDQWEDTDFTYSELIEKGYEVKGYDMTNFNDAVGNMYMFFVTVLQKDKIVFECQEYQVFDDMLNTIDLTFVCRKLVKPFRKGGLGI